MNRLFYMLWTSRSLSSLASSLWLMTWIALIYGATESALMAGAVTFVRSIAVLLSGLSLPFWYQKYPLHIVAHRFQLLQFMLGILFAFALLPFQNNFSNNLLIVTALVCAACIGYSEGAASAASSAIFPRVVRQDQWVKSNSLVSTGTQMISLFGWTVGGIIIHTLGEIPVLQLSALLLGLSSLILFCVRLQESHGSTTSKTSLRSGWSILFTLPHVRMITIMDIIEGIASGIWIGAVTLVFVQQVLGQTEAWWGYINAAYYAGTLLGGLLIVKLANKVEHHLVRSIIIGSFSFSLLVLFYAWNSTPYVALLLVLIMGPCYQLRDVAQRTYIQRIIPLEEQPILFAAQQSLSTILFGLSIVFCGLIADTFGARAVYLTGGLMFFVSSIIGIWLRRHTKSAYVDPSLFT
ncbi:MFS transporter [Paenibacillus sp. UMB4589-SE434]|nr:MFS transporter [Paenibacillus sp. UMB4589-SE434]